MSNKTQGGTVIGVDEIASKFRDEVSGAACQTLPYERVIATREQANHIFLLFLRDCKIQLRLHDAFVGPLKDLETAEKKAEREYQGRKELVTDYVRGKVVVRTPDEVLALKETMSRSNSELMSRHGIKFVHMTDFFEDPKDFTGYRALNLKLAVPVGDDDYQVVELQVVADQIEAIYDVTHPHKAAAESIHDRAHLEKRDLTKEERREAAYNFAACRLYNGRASRDAGYDILLKPNLRSRHELTRNRELKLIDMVNDLERMERDR